MLTNRISSNGSAYSALPYLADIRTKHEHQHSFKSRDWRLMIYRVVTP
ncbi:MAG: hypothetical protein IKN67_04925 [Alphaproteobacteria bacterium]|nr:hypothetical protein [Alphaproteobacteria bacterium]